VRGRSGHTQIPARLAQTDLGLFAQQQQQLERIVDRLDRILRRKRFGGWIRRGARAGALTLVWHGLTVTSYGRHLAIILGFVSGALHAGYHRYVAIGDSQTEGLWDGDENSGAGRRRVSSRGSGGGCAASRRMTGANPNGRDWKVWAPQAN